MKWLFRVMIFFEVIFASCSKNETGSGNNTTSTDTVKTQTLPARTIIYTVDNITDIYPGITAFSQVQNWGPYNVHDPSILYDNGYYYCYSTDASFGNTATRWGCQYRRSSDLIDWEFLGWAFNGTPSLAAKYIAQNSGVPNDGVWAPYLMKVGDEYRLYYSQASGTGKLSAIGLATSSKPGGPWTERGLVVTSAPGITMTNAIDPSVVVTPDGKHYMVYGSAYDGIYELELDPAIGLAKTTGDKGKRIAARGSTNGTVNGNIEGPEIIYNEALKKYYLFIAYDWLETKYNVRVGRSDFPTGPFLNYKGLDMNLEQDDYPMILAPYAFQGHGGWQGTAHCSVFKKDNQYYMAHQGRPGINKYYMVLHVREIFWTDDGWPVVSPERYAATLQTVITKDEISGTWEEIRLGYRVVPGYQAEQTSADMQTSVSLLISSDGSINKSSSNKWSYDNNKLTMTWADGTIDKVIVSRGWDWENKKICLVFTGFDNQETAVWGKK